MGDVLSMDSALAGARAEERDKKIRALREEVGFIRTKTLDVILEPGKYAISSLDGSVEHKFSEDDLELSESARKAIIDVNKRLKEIHQELKALGFEPNAKS